MTNYMNESLEHLRIYRTRFCKYVEVVRTRNDLVILFIVYLTVLKNFPRTIFLLL